MGLFDSFKKKEFYPIGWDAITNEFLRLYPGQTDPKHYGTLISREFGGKDPLRGISIYDDGDYWHFVTYGMSELFVKETNNKDISGFGMEFTLRLKKGFGETESEIKNIINVLQNIARLTFDKGELFSEYEFLYTGQTQGMDAKMLSKITGFITIPDVKAKPIMSSFGKVRFIEFVGCTDAELKALVDKKLKVKELYKKIGGDVTDYSRESVI